MVADLGHTSIKTAIADRDATTLTGLRLLETRAAPSGGCQPPAVGRGGARGRRRRPQPRRPARR